MAAECARILTLYMHVVVTVNRFPNWFWQDVVQMQMTIIINASEQ